MNMRGSSIAMAVALALLSGCSWMKTNTTKRENIAPPKALVELTPSLSVQSVWSSGSGKGAAKSGVRLHPVVVDGHVYVAGVDGRISALDAASGKTLWHESVKFRLTGGPGVEGDLLVVGSLDGDVLAFDAKSGTERWRARVSSEVVTAPAISQGLVVVRCNDGRMYGFDATDGKQRWIFDRGNVPLLSLRGNAAPTINGELVISGTDGGKVIALRSSDGATAWEHAVANSDGRTEVERLSDIDGRIVIAGDVAYAAAYRGQVVALNAQNGRPLWSRPLSSYGSVAASASQVYAVDSDSLVWALDRSSGASMWKQDAFQNRWLSSPAVQGDYLVVGDIEGYVHWLSISDGREVARQRLSKVAIQGSPQVVGDTVYVEDIEGRIGAYRIAI
ncbi:MAG: outer membrane protein assembly factor BamB [Tahibacter sp.]